MSWMIIYLGLLLPTASSDLPESKPGRLIAFVLVLLRMGFTCAPVVTNRAVVSYTALPPLLLRLTETAVYFCCTGLGVTSTGRYPASCPMKPGLSSSAIVKFSPWKNKVFPEAKTCFCFCDHPAYLSLLLYYILDVKTTSTAKFTYQRIIRNAVTRNT